MAKLLLYYVYVVVVYVAIFMYFFGGECLAYTIVCGMVGAIIPAYAYSTPHMEYILSRIAFSAPLVLMFPVNVFLCK